MNERHESDQDESDQMDRLFDRVLRELPIRTAPPTLESRVFGELARRMARPWWRRSFAYWPNSARALFFAVCGVLNGLAFIGCGRILAVVRAIPPLWLYEGVAMVAALYVMLFALGAAAYRTLWAEQ